MYPNFALVASLVALAAAQETHCPALHMIVARASTEPAGTGMIGAVALDIQKRLPNSDIEAVDYPALLDPYVSSQTQGVAAMTRMVQEYAELCPNTKMVLMGYSQGAHVTADVLCGASEAGFPHTVPQGQNVTNKITAVILMGDPSRVATQSYDLGTATNNGIFTRMNPDGCHAVRDKMVSFCDAKDKFCDSGDDVVVHMGYVKRFGAFAVDFVFGMANTV